MIRMTHTIFMACSTQERLAERLLSLHLLLLRPFYCCPAEAVIVGTVVSVGIVYVTYKVCVKCFTPKKCKPCDPGVGTQAIKRTDLPPSAPHGGIPAPHSHILQ